MFLREKPLSFKIVLVLFLAGVTLGVHKLKVLSTEQQDEPEIFEPIEIRKPEHVKGIHLTIWTAANSKARKYVWDLLEQTELNTVVIGMKEYQGEVYVPGVPLANKYGAFVAAVPDLPEYLSELRRAGVYAVARLVIFKDKHLSEKRPELAVKNPDGTLWRDRAGNSWLDPYNKEVWDYNLSIAKRCIELGFQEIQFDYIRYPSDGDIRLCRYSYKQHNSSSAAHNLEAFLQESNRRLKPMGANISIDIFGLIPSVESGMGIGQNLIFLSDAIDYVSPMVYPSHYARGEYGIPDPNSEPYKVVYRTMSDAVRRLGERSSRLRPYLQDFSLGGVHYGADEVRAQIKACEDAGVQDWLLWNPNSRFTRAALRPKSGV